MEILGWSAAQNKFGDETGMCHLIVVDEGEVQSRCACGTKRHVSGQVHPNGVPNYAPRACRNCRRIAKKLDVNL